MNRAGKTKVLRRASLNIEQYEQSCSLKVLTVTDKDMLNFQYKYSSKSLPLKARKKGTWSEQEDRLLTQVVTSNNFLKWSEIAELVPERSAKQCRERWVCNLDPQIVRGMWSPEEDKSILSLQETVGNKWAKIASYLPGRTENSVKTRYKSIMRAITRAWTPEDDKFLFLARKVEKKSWEEISKLFRRRTKNAVRTRYKKLETGKALLPPKYGDPSQILWYHHYGASMCLKKECQSLLLSDAEDDEVLSVLL